MPKSDPTHPADRDPSNPSGEAVTLFPTADGESESTFALVTSQGSQSIAGFKLTPVLPQAPVDPPALNRVATPASLVRALRKCWMVAVPVGLVLGIGAAVAVWTFRPNKVTSFALLRVASSPERILDSNGPQKNSGDYVRTQLAIVRSSPILREALKDDKVRQLPVVAAQPDPVAWLDKQLTAEQIQGTEIVRLSLTSRGDGVGYAEVLNSIVAVYLDAVKKTEYAVQLARLNELQRVYNETQGRVRQMQESLQSLTRDLKGGNSEVIAIKQKALIDEYGALKRELAGLGARSRELEVKAEGYKRRLQPAANADAADPKSARDNLIEALAERDLESDPKVSAKLAEISALEERLEQMKKLVAANSAPTLLKDNLERIRLAKGELEQLRESRRQAAVARQRLMTTANIEMTLRDAELELETLTKQRAAVQAEVDRLKGEVDNLGLSSSELESRSEEVKTNQAFVRGIWEQKERLEIELKAAGLERVTLLAPAEPAAVLNPMGRIQETGVAGLGAFVFGLFLVALREFRRGRVMTLSDVTHGLHLPVIGTLPVLPGRSAPEFMAAQGSKAEANGGRSMRAMVESIDAVRTTLLTSRLKARCPVVMVASPSPAEGKSTLAAHLALSLARSGRKTLLIDGDLRKPSISHLVKQSDGRGLSEVLAGLAQVRDVVVPTPIANLSILPAGAFSSEAAVGLSNNAAHTVLAELRRKYEFIIVDSSPLMLVPDGFMLGRSVDGVVFSVRPGVSEVADVHAAYERTRDHRLPFLGVVVNGVAQRHSYGRGYDYGYGTKPDAAAKAVAE